MSALLDLLKQASSTISPILGNLSKFTDIPNQVQAEKKIIQKVSPYIPQNAPIRSLAKGDLKGFIDQLTKALEPSLNAGADKPGDQIEYQKNLFGQNVKVNQTALKRFVDQGLNLVGAEGGVTDVSKNILPEMEPVVSGAMSAFGKNLKADLAKINQLAQKLPNIENQTRVFLHLNGEKIALTSKEKSVASQVTGFLEKLGLPEDKTLNEVLSNSAQQDKPANFFDSLKILAKETHLKNSLLDIKQKLGVEKPNISTPQDFFHGSSKTGLTELKTGQGNLGEGVYLTKNAGEARSYAAGYGGGVDPSEFEAITPNQIYKVQVDPSKLFKTQAMSLDEKTVASLKQKGFSGIQTPHETIVFDPKQVQIKGVASPSEFANTGNASGIKTTSTAEDLANLDINQAKQNGVQFIRHETTGYPDVSKLPPIDRTQLTGKQLDLPTELLQRLRAGDKSAQAEIGKYINQTREVPSSPLTRMLGLDKEASARPPQVDVSAQAANRAETIGAMSEGKVGKFDDSTKAAFQDWVNARRATGTEALIQKKIFKGLDTQGMRGIFTFQAGEKEGELGTVKEFFDRKYAQLKKAGVEFNYKQDYLPQLWNNTPEQINQVFGRSLGLKPGFTLQSVIKDYETGIRAGLVPKYKNISSLVGNYEQRANKALADVGFFNHLADEGLIQPSSKAPYGWITINPDRFPKMKVQFEGDNQFSGSFKAPPELAKIVNNYLSEPNGTLAAAAGFVSAAKNRLLSFGIPKTAINFHGFNILARHTLFGTGSNPVVRMLTGATYMLHPGAAESFLNKTLSTAPEAIKHGLTVGVEDHGALSAEAQKFLTSFGKNWSNTFEAPLFEKMIPSLKLSSYNNLVKNGMEGKDAAKIINNVYGGLNLDEMGRNKDMQNLFRTIALTPDWLESTFRLGGNLTKSFTENSLVAKRYRTMAATLMGSVVALNAANKLTSGHYAYQNEPGHAFELEAGFTKDGQKRFIRPYGTAIDFLRLPVDIGIGLIKGDYSVLARTIRNRLSPPAGFTIGALTDTNYAGQKIGYQGKDKYGGEMTLKQRAGGIASEVSQAVGFPSFLMQGINTLTGRQGVEQGVLQGMELPIRYSGGAYSKAQQQMKGITGKTGAALYQQNQKVSGQDKLSPKQEAIVRQNPSKYDQVIIQRKIEGIKNKMVSIKKDQSLTNEEKMKKLKALMEEGQKYLQQPR